MQDNLKQMINVAQFTDTIASGGCFR